MSNSKRPFAYGECSGPAIKHLCARSSFSLACSSKKGARETHLMTSTLVSSTRTQMPGGSDVERTASSFARCAKFVRRELALARMSRL